MVILVKECDRCGNPSDKLYHEKFTNDCGEEINMNICIDCEDEIANGGDPFEDAGEIFLDRWESEYAYEEAIQIGKR